MAVLKFPKGVCSISVDGAERAVGKDGLADVPATAVPELMAAFGAQVVPDDVAKKLAAEAEARAKADAEARAKAEAEAAEAERKKSQPPAK